MDVEKSSEEDFMSLLLQLVREQTKSKMLSGKDKKINVLNQIRKVLGEEVYHRYEPLLAGFTEATALRLFQPYK